MRFKSLGVVKDDVDAKDGRPAIGVGWRRITVSTRLPAIEMQWLRPAELS
jgi:hypothetical protein